MDDEVDTKQTHACPHPRCTSIVSNEFFACRKHWYQLPGDLRVEISRASRSKRYDVPGAAAVYLAVAREAIEFYRAGQR